MNVTFHFAETESERNMIYRLRYRVYVEEMQIFGSIADHARGMLIDENDDNARLLYARIDGKVVGALRLNLGADGHFSDALEQTYNLPLFGPVVDSTKLLVITRFVVGERYRGSMLGFNMIREVAKTCVQEQIEVALCDCQPHLVGYYQRIGFLSYACNLHNDPEFGIVVPLALVTGDMSHLEEVNSPLLPIFAQRNTNSQIVMQLAQRLGSPAVKDAVQLFEDDNDELEAFLTGGHVPLFNGLSAEEVTDVISYGHVFDCAPGDLVVRKGQPVNTMYILISGSLEVRTETQVVNKSTPGEVVGELALLLVTRRTANVFAGKEGAKLLSLNDKSLARCFNTPSEMSSRLLLNLSKLLASKLALTMAEGPALSDSELPLV